MRPLALLTNPCTLRREPDSPSTFLDIDNLDFDFVGNGFLRYQVRRLVGALLEVGTGRRSADDFRSLLATPEPGSPVWTATARGLTLELR